MWRSLNLMVAGSHASLQRSSVWMPPGGIVLQVVPASTPLNRRSLRAQRGISGRPAGTVAASRNAAGFVSGTAAKRIRCRDGDHQAIRMDRAHVLRRPGHDVRSVPRRLVRRRRRLSRHAAHQHLRHGRGGTHSRYRDHSVSPRRDVGLARSLGVADLLRRARSRVLPRRFHLRLTSRAGVGGDVPSSKTGGSRRIVADVGGAGAG
jgi:hypothetical protein